MNTQEMKMREAFPYFAGISLAYGALFAFCFYRNLFGNTFFLYTAGTVLALALFLKKLKLRMKKVLFPLFSAVLLCGAAVCITDSALLQWGSWFCVILLLLAAMLEQFRGNFCGNVSGWLCNACRLFGSTFRCAALPVRETVDCLEKRREKAEGDRGSAKYILAGFAAAAAAMCLILPLLFSSDLVFGSLIKRFLEDLITRFSDVIGVLLSALAGSLLLYGFFSASCRAGGENGRETAGVRHRALTGIVFAAVIAAVYLLYAGVQVVYLFAGAGKLPEGVTYSEYARTGFWQLAVVAVLNVVLVMVCSRIFEKQTALQVFLLLICLCTFVMTASAAYRMVLYVEAYQLTFLRLLVFWLLGTAAVLMAGVTAAIFRDSFPLVRCMLLTAVCSYLVFAMIRPDYLVAAYNIEHTETLTEEDFSYLLRLSLDAAPAVAEISEKNTFAGNDSTLQAEVRWELHNYFQRILAVCRGKDFRQINYSTVLAAQAAEKYLSTHDPVLG